MKKAVSLILTLVMCLSLCACGGQKYAGTYVDENAYTFDSNYLGYYGTKTLVLNKDGTGEFKFVVDRQKYSAQYYTELESPIKVNDFPLTWEVVDGYLYMKGTHMNMLSGQIEGFYENTMYKLVGKSLQGFHGGEWKNEFTKTQ